MMHLAKRLVLIAPGKFKYRSRSSAVETAVFPFEVHIAEERPSETIPVWDRLSKAGKQFFEERIFDGDMSEDGSILAAVNATVPPLPFSVW